MRPDRLVVGAIVKPHGIRGEVAVQPLSDAPERFAPGARLAAGDPPRDLTVRHARPHQGRLLVTFAEISDRTAAEELRGLTLSIAIDEARPLPEGSWYPHDLEGLVVFDEEGTRLGEWARAEESPAHDVWVVRDGSREVLVPAVKEVVREVDVAGRRIVIAPPEGLFA